MDEEEGVSVILVTGFLESGKTTFLRDAVTQEYFQIEDRTLLINCESGEEEYDPAMLAKYRTDYTEIDSEENFTPETLAELDRRFKPGRVLIEYNPLWGMQRFEEMKLPEGWEIIQQIGLVDSTTYVVYRTNMKSLFTEMAKYCELFIFNRASKEMPLADFRRGIKAANPSCDVVFEDKDGEQIDIFEDRPSRRPQGAVRGKDRPLPRADRQVEAAPRTDAHGRAESDDVLRGGHSVPRAAVPGRQYMGLWRRGLGQCDRQCPLGIQQGFQGRGTGIYCDGRGEGRSSGRGARCVQLMK